MYAQLGNIQFAGLTSFESFERKDSTTYAQHDLVSGKPRLQPIANDLEELNITLKLRAEFCNPTYNILRLKGSKDDFEVLPLVMGNGRYIGDYVITEMGETHNVTFADGQVIEASVTVSLKEYVTPDKLLQAQQAARKRAWAVNATPVNTGLKTIATTPELATVNLSVVNSLGRSVDGQLINATNNASKQHSIITGIAKTLMEVEGKIDEFNSQLQTLEQKYNPAQIVAAAAAVKNAALGFQNIIPSLTFPITSFNDLQLNNLQLQSSLLGLKQVATILNYTVITRRG